MNEHPLHVARANSNTRTVARAAACTSQARGSVCTKLAAACMLLAAVLSTATGCMSRPPLPPQALRMNTLATEALREGDLETAEIRLKLALDFSPRFVEAWVNLGLVELRRGNLEHAQDAFRRARDLNRDLPVSHHGLGLVAEARGSLREAEGYYLAALKVDPAFVPALSNRGRLLFALGDFDDARLTFLTLLQVDVQSDIGWSGLIETYVKLGRTTDANAAISTALDKAPNALLARLCSARRALRERDFSAAREVAEGVLESADAVVVTEGHRVLALAYLGAGDKVHARQHALHVLGQKPEDPSARHVLALAQ